LLSYRWPGNIRELRNVIERAVVLCPSDVVTPEYLPDILCNDRSQLSSTTAAPSPSLDDLEREQIIRVMAESPTLESAANKLGINVVTLWRRRKRYGLDSTPHFAKN
jgi:NtrC-family two-component system response regulator AlgB